MKDERADGVTTSEIQSTQPAMTESAPASPRLRQILDFLLFCDRFKKIERHNLLADASRRETDAEHAWHLSLYALLLHGELGFEADLGHTLALLAVHDLVEILAGDTFAYDAAGVAGQAERETAAAAELFGRLPDDLRDRVAGWWREFEAGETAEARFARALDRLQPFSLNVASGGISWHDHKVTRAQTERRMAETRSADPALAALVDHLYARADAAGLLPD